MYSSAVPPSDKKNLEASLIGVIFSKSHLGISILLILWFITFFPIYPDMVNSWLNHSDNSHGILVPFISLYLILTKLARLALVKYSNSNLGAIGLVLSLMLYLVGYAAGIAVLSRCMMVCSLICLILYCFGKDCLRELSFPLFFLFFMIPVPDSLLNIVSFPLQLFVTKVSTIIIQALSIPAYREGNMVYLAFTQLEVAEACSGIRSLVSYTMLSVIFAYKLPKKWVRKAAIVASVVPLALFSNILRVTCTGILAHLYGDKVARGFLHESSGLVVFALGFVLLSLEFHMLNRKSSPGGS